MTCLRFGSPLVLLAAIALWATGSVTTAEDGHSGEHPAAQAPAGEHAKEAHDGKAHAQGGHDAHAEGGHGDDGELPGLNPLGTSSDLKGDLPLWSAITFAIFFLLLAKFAWGPLRDGLDAREAKIRRDIADAESNRVKAEALFREYELKLGKAQDEVKEILSEARRDADHVKQEILTTAERESLAMRQRAVTDIERARDQALGDLFDFVSRNVMQATEQVVGRSLTGPDHERLVRDALADLDLRKN